MSSKYYPGQSITDVEKLIAFGIKGRLFFWGDKPRPLNWAFLQGLPLRVIISACRNGKITMAVPKDDELAKQMAWEDVR